MRHRSRGVHRRAVPGYAFVPGHETIGILEESARTAASVGACAPATASRSRSSCRARACEPCRTGVYRRCERHGLADMYGFVPVDRRPGLWGGYAEYQYLAPDSLLVPVAADLDPVTATLFNPLGAGIRWAVTVPETQPATSWRCSAPACAGSRRARRRSPPARDSSWSPAKVRATTSRLAAAAQFGADLAVDVEREDPVAALRRGDGALADVVVDVTAKAPAALGQAVRLARTGGTIVLAGTRGTTDDTRLRPRPRRLQGAAGARRARRRRVGVSRRAGSARDRVGSRSRSCRGRSPASTTYRRCSSDMAGEGDPPPVHAVFAPSLTLRLHHEHGALRRAHETAFVLDIDTNDRGAPGQRDDAGRCGSTPVGDRREVVDLELRRRRPRAARDHRIAHGAEHVVAQRGDDAAVQVAERGRRARRARRSRRAASPHRPRRVPQAEETRQAPRRRRRDLRGSAPPSRCSSGTRRLSLTTAAN